MKNRVTNTESTATGKAKKALFASTALCVTLAASAASAITNVEYIQAASGKPFVSFGAAQYRDVSNAPGYFILDGRNVYAEGLDKIWVTPVNVKLTNAVLRGQQFKTTSGAGQVQSRSCSFTSTGAFFGCSAMVAGNQVFAVTVPFDGSAFLQSFFRTDPIEGATATLFHFKAWND